MENVCVCERALLILENVNKFIQQVTEKKINRPTCKSYSIVEKHMKDSLLRAKLEFFRYIAVHMQPFLGHYQTDRPMIPFIMSDLTSLLKQLMGKILKPEAIEVTPSQIFTSVNIDEKDNQLSYNKIDLGFSTDKELKQATTKFKLNDRKVLEFKLECKEFVVKVVKKLLEKSPGSYSLVRYLSALNPKEMANNPIASKSKFKKCLNHLVNVNRVDERECDGILMEFEQLIGDIPSIGNSLFTTFNPYADRLDEFYITHLSDPKFERLLTVIKLCLVLSHGQADVERGFSVNKKVEVENLKEESIIAQRMICDYVSSVGGVLNVPISKELLNSCAHARQRYMQDLEKQKEQNTSAVQKRKRERIETDIEELKRKSKQAKIDADALFKSADEYGIRAEKELSYSHMSKSNCLRDKGKEKKQLIEVLKEQLEIKNKELKDC